MSEEITVNDKIRNALDLYTQEAKKLLDEKFATKEELTEAVANALTDAEKAKLSGVEEGAQKNIIEKIFVDGTEQSPDENKKVNISLADFAKNNSPTFTGTPTAPTVSDLDSLTDQLATVSFCNALIRRLVGTSPETLNTLQELAAAIHNDPNYATAVATELASKQTKSDALTSISTATTGADEFLYTTEKNKFASSTVTDFGRRILKAKEPAEVRKLLGFVETQEVQESDTSVIDRVGNLWQKLGEVTRVTEETKTGLAWQFPSSKDGLYMLPDFTLKQGQNITVEAWVSSLPTFTSSDSSGLFGLFTPDSNFRFSVYLAQREIGTWTRVVDRRLYPSATTTMHSVQNSGMFISETPQHVAAVLRDSEVSLFVGGHFCGSVAIEQSFDPATFEQVHLANPKDSSSAPKGIQIEQFRFSNTARYTADFVLPEGAFIADQYTIALI